MNQAGRRKRSRAVLGMHVGFGVDDFRRPGGIKKWTRRRWLDPVEDGEEDWRFEW